MIAMLSLDRYTHNTCHTTTFNRFQAKISILGYYFAQNIIKSAIFITFILNFCSFNAQQTKFTVSHWIEYSYLFLKSPQWSNLDNCNVFKRIYISKNIVPMRARSYKWLFPLLLFFERCLMVHYTIIVTHPWVLPNGHIKGSVWFAVWLWGYLSCERAHARSYKTFPYSKILWSIPDYISRLLLDQFW